MDEALSCCRTEINENTLMLAQKVLDKKNEWLEERTNIFALLGNKARLDIVYVLLNFQRLCVCDFCDLLKMSPPAISQHLRKLKDSKLLVSKKEGVTVFYAVKEEYKEELSKYLNVPFIKE
jgi:DNA-binding transcriptional ArsR family regulator